MTTRTDPLRPAYIYVMKEVDGGRFALYKIGFSHDPEKRLKVIEQQVHRKLELFLTALAPDARSAERDLHRLLHKRHIQGEWFMLRPVDIKAMREFFHCFSFMARITSDYYKAISAEDNWIGKRMRTRGDAR